MSNSPSTRVGICGAWALVVLLLSTAPGPPSDEPAWFYRDDVVVDYRRNGSRIEAVSEERLTTSQLQQDSEGNIAYRGETLSLEPAAGKLKGAVLYPASGILLTVTKASIVTLYQARDGDWVAGPSWSPKVESRLDSVRFTRVPGLIHLLWIDVAHEASIGDWAQEYPDRYDRVALTDEAASWHGVPIGDPEQRLLSAAYRVRSGGLDLITDSIAGTRIELREPLGEPFRSGPGDDLAQSVFVFPGRGILCRTESGWSLHECDGTWRQSFPAEGIQWGWWCDPTWGPEGPKLLHCTGPNGTWYRLDEASGKLVEIAH